MIGALLFFNRWVSDVTWEVSQAVEKFDEQDVLWYLEKGSGVTGHRHWLTKISHSETTSSPCFMVRRIRRL